MGCVEDNRMLTFAQPKGNPLTMNAPRFLARLKPVDFRAIAKRGCFVYAYLRGKDSTSGPAGSPYYIGLASRHDRPFGPHACHVPTRRELAVCLKSGLTREEAAKAEAALIEHYGRIDLGTGILRNLKEGGDMGGIYGPEVRRKITEANLRRAEERPESFAKSDEWREKVSAAHLRSSAKIAKRYGLSLEVWTKLDSDQRRKYHSDFFSTRRRRAAGQRSAEVLRAEKRETVASRYGLTADQYLSLPKEQKWRAHARYRLGHRGEALFADRLPQPCKPSRVASHAARYGMDVEVWKSLTSAQKNRVNKKYRDGVRDLSKLLDFSDARSSFIAAHNQKQKEASAKQLGLPLAKYLQLSRNQKATMRQFLKRNPGSTGLDYCCERGW